MIHIDVGLLGILIGLTCSVIAIPHFWRTATWPMAKSMTSAICGCEGALLANFAKSLGIPLFISYSFYLIPLGGFVAAAVSLLAYDKFDAKKFTVLKTSIGVSFVIAGYILLVAFATGILFHRGLLVILIDYIRWVRTPTGSLVTPIIVAAVGCVGFILRERQRQLYAIFEGSFGSITAVATLVNAVIIFDDRAQRASLVFDLTFTAFAFVSGIYVLIRAFDNYEKHLQAEVKLHRATLAALLSAQTKTSSAPGAAQQCSDGWFADRWQRAVGRRFPEK